MACRSLTPRQRELLQQYADEAEGRPSTRSGSQDPGTSEGSSSTSRQSTISDGKNGTISFSSPDHSPSEGRMSRIWQKFRELIGF